MIPTHVQQTISDFVGVLRHNPAILNENADYDALERDMSNATIWDGTLCTLCNNAEIYFDIINPGAENDKTEWTSAVRTTIRCSKLMEKFIIQYIPFGKAFSIPGVRTFRVFPCPKFEEYEPEKDQKEEAE